MSQTSKIWVLVPELPKNPRGSFASRLARFLKALPPQAEVIPLGNEFGQPGLYAPGIFSDGILIVVDHPWARRVLFRHALDSTRLSLVVARLGREEGEDSFSGEWTLHWFKAAYPVWTEELWDFSGEYEAEDQSRLLPRRIFQRPRIEPEWILRRLGGIRKARAAPPLGGQSGPARGLASIIIPCWNGLADTRRCLESVIAKTDGPHEIIVVDNGSKDGTPDYVRSLKNPRIRLIENPVNRGFASAVNQGMAAAKGDYFVWLNSDAIVPCGWLGRLIAWAERSLLVGAVGPLSNSPGISFQCLRNAPRKMKQMDHFARALSLRNAGRSSWVPRIAGFCFLVKRAAARQAGLLDERFGLGLYEDYDYCLRLRQAGYGILVAEDAFVYHGGHKTFKRNGVNFRRIMAANRDAFIHKWCRLAMEFLETFSNPNGPDGTVYRARSPR